MNKRLFRIIAVSLMLFCGAGQLSAETDSGTELQIRQAMERFPALIEFGKLYTNGFYNLKYENGRHYVEVRTLIRPCYELVMVVPVFTPKSGQPLSQQGAAEVELWAIKRIYRNLSGVLTVEREYPQHIISAADWLKVYQNNGDFSTVGITLTPGIEIQGLRDYRDLLRKEANVGW